MEGKKNLCAMIPAELHARIMAEKEEMKLGTLAEYVERIFAEHLKEETICRQNAPLR